MHPGDTTRGYIGLHWIPSAKAIVAGEQKLRSTLFFVDKSKDGGPVLAQSAPLDIMDTLKIREASGSVGLVNQLSEIKSFLSSNRIMTYQAFQEQATPQLRTALEVICSSLQEAIKEAGDWKIYPFAVHNLIARGRVEIDGRSVYIDGQEMPAYGFRPDQNER